MCEEMMIMTNITIIDYRYSLSLILTLMIVSLTFFVAGMDELLPGNLAQTSGLPSTAPQPQNEVRDISGWGMIGKIHPKILIKDQLIKQYHNRPLDPRYLHLQNYGNLQNSVQSSTTTTTTANKNLANKLFNF
ncbi:uncharacterized protein LOC113799263 [Dermatophagoides pteronyssinus]|uniref:uncharacterized protein LOC113799263 n=1 Tax=Dermatophagoides pteronyssinus TaxID=6956 RepID=UPI003F666CDE